MLRLGGLSVPDGTFVVMAIVNRTPDSFYDRGATYELAAAVERVDRVVAEGADMVDVGGVKAAPGEEVDAAPRVVDDVGPGGQRLARHLRPPGVDRDGQRRVGGADGGDQVDGAADLLGGVHLLAGRGLHPADVDHVGPLGDHLVDPLHGLGELVGGAAVVERVGGAVDDRHDDQAAVRHVEGTQSQHAPSQAD